jgi:hypothetical protein
MVFLMCFEEAIKPTSNSSGYVNATHFLDSSKANPSFDSPFIYKVNFYVGINTATNQPAITFIVTAEKAGNYITSYPGVLMLTPKFHA